MNHKPVHVERGGEVRADTPDKWSEDDTARQKQGLPNKNADRTGRHNTAPPSGQQGQAKRQAPLKGTGT